MKKFALIGASGYIAPRHAKAIKETGHEIVTYLDPHDNVGYMDQYFPDAKYFKDTELFDRYLDNTRRNQKPIDFVSICSPNYLHDSHIRLGLRNKCDVICEKPIVLKSSDIDTLKKIEKETGKKVYTILQLRHHPEIIKLKQKVKKNKKYVVDLTYITPRGQWYNNSWKGDEDKSGGVLFNIGIHFFDMLMWVFGDLSSYNVDVNETHSKGFIELENARINYFLSLNKEDLPWKEWKPYRNISVDGEQIDFSQGFTDLHIKSYEEIIKGNGFGLDDIKSVIEMIEKLKTLK